jgi:hypothetical protein
MIIDPRIEVRKSSRFTWEASLKVGQTSFIAYGFTARIALKKLTKHARGFNIPMGGNRERSS